MKRREHMAIRALMAIVVIIFVFWCGFEFGEIRGSVGMERGYGYRMMQNGYGNGNALYGGGTVRQVVIPPTSTNTNTSATSK